MTDTRKNELSSWALKKLQSQISITLSSITVQVVSGDASFRRYFRVNVESDSFILVDAPPAHENCRSFVTLAELFRDAGMTTPEVLAVDYDKGFMLLQDFGDKLYLGELKQEFLSKTGNDFDEKADLLYGHAIDALVDLQVNASTSELPPYDRALLAREMALFETWFCKEYLGMKLDRGEQDIIAAAFTLLEDAALAQPVVAVHRDYHSRNLMVLDQEKFATENNPGVIDFQDAVAGPYTYDLVSLLRDCYVQWHPDRVRSWALGYLEQALEAEVIPARSEPDFLRDFDLMGLQRQLKVMGIFSRLCIRDNKPQFLADLPLVIDYFLDVIENYPELAEFSRWFKNKILPIAVKKLPVGSLCAQ